MTANKNKLENSILEIFSGSSGAVCVAAIVFSFLAATLILFLVGRNPSGMYQAMVQAASGFDSRRETWNARYVGEWLVSSIPLILCGLSVGFAARAGLFNLGAEGQYIAGLTAAQIVAVRFPPVPVLHWVVAVFAAMVAAAVWGGIAGFFKARFRVSEVLSSIMMNYIALYIHRIATMRLAGSGALRTVDFHVTASISSPMLASISNGSRLGYGLWFTIAAIFIYWIVMEKTTFGLSLRATGFNREAAFCEGVRVNVNIILAMAVSGAFAGLAGASVSLGAFSYGRVLTVFDNYGFDGIAVALGGNCTAAGIALAGLLFGMLKSAQPLMQSRQIPTEITSIIMGLVVVFVSMRAGIQLFIEWRTKKKNGGG